LDDLMRKLTAEKIAGIIRSIEAVKTPDQLAALVQESVESESTTHSIVILSIISFSFYLYCRDTVDDPNSNFSTNAHMYLTQSIKQHCARMEQVLDDAPKGDTALVH